MSSNFSKARQSLLSPLAFLLIVFSLFVFVSCNKKQANSPTCMKLTKKQINHWVKEGMTKGENSIAYLRVKTAYGGPGTVFRTFVTGLTIKGEIVPESLTELVPGDDCIIGLDDTYMVIGSSIFKVPYDKIFEKDELKKGISEITFVPYVDDTTTIFKMLNYTTRSQEGLFTIEALEQDVLCPPCKNCIPPYPKECKDIQSKRDSL